MESETAAQIQPSVRRRLERFAQGGGYLKTSAQGGGAPKWLKAAQEKFFSSHPYPKEIEVEERGLKMMREAMRMVDDKQYRMSVAFGPSGAIAGVACWRKRRYHESRRMDYHYPEMYLAWLGTNGRVEGAGTALMLEVAKEAVAVNRPVFAYVSHAGSFYSEMGWEMVKKDPSNDHWLWRLETCQAIVAELQKEKTQEAIGL
jgi:hypothetical protein